MSEPCPECGRPVPSDGRFCAACGVSLAEARQAAAAAAAAGSPAAAPAATSSPLAPPAGYAAPDSYPAAQPPHPVANPYAPLPPPPPYGVGGQPAPPPGPYGQAIYGYPARNGDGRAALILGILSICLFWIPFLYLVTSVPMGIIAIVKGNSGRSAAARGEATNGGQATAGFVTGIVGLGLCALNVAVGVLIGVSSA